MAVIWLTVIANALRLQGNGTGQSEAVTPGTSPATHLDQKAISMQTTSLFRHWRCSMDGQRTLEDDISTAFARACQERDWETAEFLFQALEAITRREGDPSRVEFAVGELVEHFSVRRH